MNVQNYSAKQLFLGGLSVPLVIGLLIGGVVLAKNSFDGDTGERHIRGGKKALVTLVEYSDFQCPYCQAVAPTLQQILQEYGDKVSLEYRHYPLSFHPMAQPAAEASECAAEQGKFWEYHDALFANQSGLSPELFRNLAQTLKLNVSRFTSCLDSGKYTAKIQAQLLEGQQKGVQGTPGTFVNGELVSGAQPFEAFKRIIDSKLQ